MKSNSISDYSQPNFYHFTEDSVLISKYAASFLEDFLEGRNLIGLDLCAGSGVVGIELLVRTNRFKSFDFLEYQASFESHFKHNQELFVADSDVSINYVLGSFEDYAPDVKYDFIVSNPPYFDPDAHRIGKDRNKNICRFFVEGSLSSYLYSIINLLSDSGIGLFLSRESSLEIEKLAPKNSIINVVQEYKGATLFSISILNVD
jgi:tRNA1Val (adenine37-N6)-methyltransferase